MSCSCTASLSLCLLLSSFALFAEEEGLIQEVFLSELVYPQEEGEIQFTLAPRYRSSDESEIYEVPLTIEYGLTDAWQVELAWTAFVHRGNSIESSTAGIGDLEIGTKYSFMNLGGTDFHAAAGIEVSFPTGDVDRELSEGFIEYELFVIMAKDFPNLANLHLFTQAGIGLMQRVRSPSEEDDLEPAAHEAFLNVGLFIPWDSIRFTAEVSWNSNKWNHGGTESFLVFAPGLVWSFPKGWEAGFAVPFGLNENADNFQLIGHLIFEF